MRLFACVCVCVCLNVWLAHTHTRTRTHTTGRQARARASGPVPAGRHGQGQLWGRVPRRAAEAAGAGPERLPVRVREGVRVHACVWVCGWVSEAFWSALAHVHGHGQQR
jgi:hypothetical protein